MGLHAQLSVDRRKYMEKLSNEELAMIEGGVNITGTILKSFATLANTIADLGRNFGSALRRIASNKMCAL